MKQFPAFFVRILTNFGKIIALFVDSKYESTRNMSFEINGKEYRGSKQTNNVIIFYFLDDQLVKCSYKHQIKPFMYSDDKYFLDTNGIVIYNNRNDKDIAIIDDILYSGML